MAARDRHVPLLRVRCGADCGVSKQDVVNCLPLGTVGGDRVATDELPILWRHNATIFQPDRAIRFYLRRRDDFAVRKLATVRARAVRFQLEFIPGA